MRKYCVNANSFKNFNIFLSFRKSLTNFDFTCFPILAECYAMGKHGSIKRINYEFCKTGVNFANILLAAFLYESVLSSFSVRTFRFVIFW